MGREGRRGSKKGGDEGEGGKGGITKERRTKKEQHCVKKKNKIVRREK